MTDALTERTMVMPPIRRRKSCHVGAPAIFILNQACHTLREAFGECGIYLVGSAAERPDWRDVDVRLMLPDTRYAELFGDPRHHESNGLWSLMCVAISEHLSRLADLPVDFQIQDTSYANERHPGHRDALGIWINAGR